MDGHTCPWGAFRVRRLNSNHWHNYRSTLGPDRCGSSWVDILRSRSGQDHHENPIPLRTGLSIRTVERKLGAPVVRDTPCGMIRRNAHNYVEDQRYFTRVLAIAFTPFTTSSSSSFISISLRFFMYRQLLPVVCLPSFFINAASLSKPIMM